MQRPQLTPKKFMSPPRVGYEPVPVSYLTGHKQKQAHPKNYLSNYHYKYQGQELQDELGLNWYSFKWRNYMPDIGRFFNIDPLAEEYTDWAPYVFSGNRVIDSRELEGLEPVPVVAPAPVPAPVPGAYPRSGTLQPARLPTKTEVKEGFNKLVNWGKGVVLGETIKKAAIVVLTTEAAKTLYNSVLNSDSEKSSSSQESTKPGARTEPKDLQEKLTLDEAKSGQGEPIMKGKLKDDKYKKGDTEKMQHNHDHGDGTKTEVHYDKNKKTGETSNFKIKDDTNSKSRGHRYP